MSYAGPEDPDFYPFCVTSSTMPQYFLMTDFDIMLSSHPASASLFLRHIIDIARKNPIADSNDKKHAYSSFADGSLRTNKAPFVDISLMTNDTETSIMPSLGLILLGKTRRVITIEAWCRDMVRFVTKGLRKQQDEDHLLCLLAERVSITHWSNIIHKKLKKPQFLFAYAALIAKAQNHNRLDPLFSTAKALYMQASVVLLETVYTLTDSESKDPYLLNFTLSLHLCLYRNIPCAPLIIESLQGMSFLALFNLARHTAYMLDELTSAIMQEGLRFILLELNTKYPTEYAQVQDSFLLYLRNYKKDFVSEALLSMNKLSSTVASVETLGLGLAVESGLELGFAADETDELLSDIITNPAMLRFDASESRSGNRKRRGSPEPDQTTVSKSKRRRLG